MSVAHRVTNWLSAPFRRLPQRVGNLLVGGKVADRQIQWQHRDKISGRGAFLQRDGEFLIGEGATNAHGRGSGLGGGGSGKDKCGGARNKGTSGRLTRARAG